MATNLLAVLVDVGEGVLNALNLLGVLVRYFDAKLLLESHDEFNRIQGVCSEIIDKAGIGSDFTLINTELINDNLFYLVLN